jgi:DNA methylase
MLEDALLDLTNRGDIVIDPFLGSGSTLISLLTRPGESAVVSSSIRSTSM